jgi:hypothetical protein
MILRELQIPQAFRQVRLVYRASFPRQASLELLSDNIRRVLPNTVRPVH